MNQNEARFFGIIRELDVYKKQIQDINEMHEEKKKVITKQFRERIESWFKEERA